jgi:hypothetical protein
MIYHENEEYLEMLEINSHLCENNIKTNFRNFFCEGRRSMELSEDRVQWLLLVSAVLNLRVLLPEN